MAKSIFLFLSIISLVLTIKVNNNPYDFDLVSFPLSSGARCLDGSKYGIYQSNGYDDGKNNIVIYFWGGGWCLGRDRNSFLDDCVLRTTTELGSSTTWGQKLSVDDYLLSGDKNINPNFYNWNRFSIPYCDGSGHQGHVTDPIKHGDKTLFFRGKTNVLTALNHVLSVVGIENIENLIITGRSAGGLATFNWSQYISDFIKDRGGKKANIFSIPDSGFFIDHVSEITKDNDFTVKFKVIYDIVNKEVPPISMECIKDHPNDPHMCLFAQNIAKYIKIPLLMLQPGYDSWQIQNILQENCANTSIKDCDQQKLALLNEYKNSQNQLIKNVFDARPNIGGWVPSCLKHCWDAGDYTSKNWEVPQQSENTIAYAIKFLITNKDAQTSNQIIDKVNWPDNKGCS